MAFSFQKKKSLQEQRKLEDKIRDWEERFSHLEKTKNNKIQDLEKKMNEGIEMNMNLLTNKSYFNALYTQMKQDIISKIKEVYTEKIKQNYQTTGKANHILAKADSFKIVIQNFYPNYPEETNDLIDEILEDTIQSKEFIKIFVQTRELYKQHKEQSKMQEQKHNKTKGMRK